MNFSTYSSNTWDKKKTKWKENSNKREREGEKKSLNIHQSKKREEKLWNVITC